MNKGALTDLTKESLLRSNQRKLSPKQHLSENENHFLFHCDRYKTIRQQITSDIVLKYPFFNLFNDTEKTIFLFNNADSFICKKLGFFIYEALHLRETCNFI